MKPQELVESAARATSNCSDSAGLVWPTFDTVSSSENMCFDDLLALADAAYLNSTAIHPGTNNGVKNARVTSNGSDSEGTCVMPTFDTVSRCEIYCFADMLALAEAAHVNFAANHSGSNNGVKNPFNPISRLQSDPIPSSTNMLSSCHNFSLEQTSIITINDNPGEAQVTPPTADKAMRGKSGQVGGVQINLVEEEDVPSTKLDNNETPNNQELSEPVIESSMAAASTPSMKNHNPDKGGSHGIGLNQSPLLEESSQNDSNGSSSGNLTTRLHMCVTKRKHSASSAHASTSSMNLNEIVFPNVRKKGKNKTSGKRRQVVGMQVNVVKEKTVPGTKLDINKTLNNQELSEPVVESLLAAFSRLFNENPNSGNGGSVGVEARSQAPTRFGESSRATTRFRDFATLTTTKNCNILPGHFTKQPSNADRRTSEPSPALDSLVAQTCASLTKKKPTMKKKTNNSMKIWSCSDGDSEAEDPLSIVKNNIYNNSTCFRELLEMAYPAMLNEVNSQILLENSKNAFDLSTHVNFAAIHPVSNNGVKNPFNLISRLQSDPLPSSTNMLSTCHNFSLGQTSIITINDSPGEPQGAHAVTPPTADKAMRGKSRQVGGVQINLVEEKDVPSTKLDNNETPNNQELSEPVIESSVAAVSTPLKKNHNPDKGGSHGIDVSHLSPLPEESSQNDSFGSSSGNLTTRLHMGVTKRKHSASSAHASTSSMNLNEIVFPNVRKKGKNKTSGESRQVVGMQVNVVKEKTVPGTKLDKNKTPNNQELSEPVIESSVAAVSTPFNENPNPGKGGSLGIEARSRTCYSFADLLAMAEAADVNFAAIHPGSNNGVKNPFNPISRLQSDPLPSSTNMLSSCHNFSLEQTSIITINDNPGEPQGSHTVTPPTADKAMRGESSQVGGVQINLVEEEDVPSTKLGNNGTPNNQELSEPVIESSVAAVSTPLKKNHNPNKGGSHGIGLNQSPLPEESSQNDSNGSSSGNLTTRLHVGVTKRKHSASTAHAGTSSMNLNEIVFPNVRKKRKNKTSGESRQVVGMQVNTLYNSTSYFSELLQMADSIILHEVNSQRILPENSRNASDLSIGMKDATNHMTQENSDVIPGSL